MAIFSLWRRLPHAPTIYLRILVYYLQRKRAPPILIPPLSFWHRNPHRASLLHAGWKDSPKKKDLCIAMALFYCDYYPGISCPSNWAAITHMYLLDETGNYAGWLWYQGTRIMYLERVRNRINSELKNA